MKDDERNFLTTWGKIQKKGRFKYALTDGLKWSLFTAVFVLLFQFYVLDNKDPDNLIISMIINVVALVVAGFVLYYFLLWRLYEKKYQKLKEKEANQ